MGVNGERADINLNHAAVMLRLGDQTTINMALPDNERPVTVQVREIPDLINGLRMRLRALFWAA